MQGETKLGNQQPLRRETKNTYRFAKASYLNKVRWAVTLYYFSFGLCFSTWASRIPDIRVAMGLSEADLGTVLFAIPIGQLFIMPFSGKLANKYGSHNTAAIGVLLYIVALIGLGLSTERLHLMLALFFFGMFSNLANISVNTQGIHAEGLFRRAIMSAFHGAWSVAGFTGALLGLVMLAFKLSPLEHFFIVAALIILIVILQYKYLVKVKAVEPLQNKRKIFSRPDPALLWLGVMAFCCMLSEGIMFDWSGIYFKDVVGASGSLVILGYASFMVMMAAGRFLGDKVIQRVGRKRSLIISGCMISIGLYMAVLLPHLITATIAFMIVGLGVATVVPSIYSLAGRTLNVAPSIALQTVSSVSFLGFMLGPPLIGYVAHATSLRISFAIIGIFGFAIALLTRTIKGIDAR